MRIRARVGIAAFAAGAALAATMVVAPAASAAHVGECHTYTLADIRAPYRIEEPPVDCGVRHTAQTVGLHKSLGLTRLPVVNPSTGQVTKRVSALMVRDAVRCDEIAADAARQKAPSRFGTRLQYQQAADGNILARCDLILYSPDGRRLSPLPDLRTIDRGAGYRRCARFRAASQEIVLAGCERADVAAAVTGRLNPRGAKPWPGRKAAADQVARICPATVFNAPTTAAHWATGGRFTCWSSILA